MILKKFGSLYRLIFLSIAFTQPFLPVPSFCFEVTSVWHGGSGSWHNSYNWTPDQVPNNDSGTTYSVFIDGGNPISSTVDLTSESPDIAVSNLTIDLGDTLIQQDLAILTIDGGDIINNGQWFVSAPNGATLIFNADSFITGTGSMNLQGCLSYVITNNGHTVTLGPNQKIQGAKYLIFEDGRFINQGAISQHGPNPMNFSPGFAEIINEGFITASGSGGINFDNGVITNTGTIQANTGSQISLLNMKITGGNLGSTGSGEITYHYNTFLRDVNLYGWGDVSNGSPVTFTDTITNSGHIFIIQTYMTAPTTIVTIGNNSLLTGTGTFQMGQSYNTGKDAKDVSGSLPIIRTIGSFTQGRLHSIRGSGYLLDNSGGMLNQGVILAEGLDPMIIDPGSSKLYNQGVIIGAGTGGLILQEGDIINQPQTEMAKEEKSGVLIPYGSIAALDGYEVTLKNVLVKNGLIMSDGSGQINFTYNTFLDNVSFSGTGYASDDSALVINNFFTNTGIITVTHSLTGTLPYVTVYNGTYLTGSGTIQMPDEPDITFRTSGIFTQTYPHTIRGAGYLLNSLGGMVNEGTVIADGANHLMIYPDERGFMNKGTLQSVNTGGIQLYNSEYFENKGTVQMDAGGLYADAGYTQTAGVTILNNSFMEMGFRNKTLSLLGGELKARGVILGNIINDSGTIYPGASVGCLTIWGNLTNTGTISMEIGGNDFCNTLDFLEISGTAHLAGELELNFINDIHPAISDSYNIISYKGLTSEFPECKVNGLPPNRKVRLDYYPNMLNVFIEERTSIQPTIQLLEPSENNTISTTTCVIRWTDEDPDDDAMISLYYSHSITEPIETTIVEDLSEDDESDFYVWDTTLVPEGIYWIHAWIDDGVNYPWFSFSPGSVKITHITKDDLINHILSGATISPARLEYADFNNDGNIDVADLVILCAIWGSSP